MKLSVKKGDYVKIIAGSDKGKTALILAVDAEKGRVTVEGKDVGQVKKAVKARKASDRSGLITMPKTIDASNVMPICSVCGKPTRVKHSIVDGKKVRMCKCGAVLETKKAKEEKKAKATVRKRTTKKAETAPVAEATPVVETAAESAGMETAIGAAPAETVAEE